MNTNGTVKYRTSDNFRRVSLQDGRLFCYNSLYNSPKILHTELEPLLEWFRVPRTVRETEQHFNGEVTDILESLIEARLIAESGIDERIDIKIRHEQFVRDATEARFLNRLEIAISDACNLRCPHCMHFNNNDVPSASSAQNISHTSVMLAIEAFLSALPKGFADTVRVHFGNGEPLINWSAVVYAVDYCEERKPFKFRYAINSNLTLMTPEMAEFIADHDFKVSTSLDGIKDVNDRQRKSLGGKGSFDRTIAGMRMLRDAGRPVDGFTVTITDSNFFETDTQLIDLAVELGVREIAMDFDLVNSVAYDIEECVDLVFDLRSYAGANGISLYGNWETPFKMLISQSWDKQPYAYCPAIDGSTLEFGVDGSIKTCGHTNTVVARDFDAKSAMSSNSSYASLIRSRLPNSNDYCRGCEIEAACGGQCHVTQEAAMKNSDVLPRMCGVMRKMTKKLIQEQYGYVLHH